MKNVFLKKEIHLALIWEKGRNKENEIKKIIDNQFEVIEQYKVNWEKKTFGKSLSAFYGSNLPNNSKKENHCGNGEFLLITFYDNKPKYGFVETSRGSEKVNLNVFELKSKCRKLTGGGHKIHTTNSVKETNHDLVLLLGLNYLDYENLIIKKFNNNKSENVLTKIPNMSIGVNGWENFEQLFYVLNSTLEYVILRNFENFPDTIKNHDDIDFLVKDLDKAIYITNASKVFNQIDRVLYKIKVANKDILVDFRFLGDDYYDYNWQNDILANKILTNKNFYRPTDEDYFYSLIYHVLIHKTFIAPDYYNKLINIYKKLPNFDEKKCNFDNYLYLLESFLKKKNYFYKKPKDSSVFFDERFVNYKRKIDNLSFLNLKNINPYLVDQWKNNSECIYFEATNEKKNEIFIKYGGIFDSARREYRILNQLKKHNQKNFPLANYYRYIPNISFVLMEKVKGIRLDYLIDSPELKSKTETFKTNLYNGIFDILETLHKEQIVHRDIRPENIIIIDDGTPFLIDFQFAVDINRKIYKEYRIILKKPKKINALGGKYKVNNHHWDDAYSFYKILEKLNFKDNHKYLNVMEKIEKLIGKYEVISVKKNFIFKYITLLKNYFRTKLIKIRN